MNGDALGRALAGGLAKSAQTGLRLRFAVVAAAHTAPNSVDLHLDGSANLTPTVKYLAAYTPTVNDVVAVLEQPTQRGPDYLVLGKTA